jgi:23S rRNA (cytidine1920-2'-O)/16S rRNA (cytidine1409-2'-O)-methyltransferase
MKVDVTQLPFVPSFAAIDLSFISLVDAIPRVSQLLAPQGQAVFLLKPQFECGPRALNKKGVVQSLSAHVGAIDKVFVAIVNCKMHIIDMDFSPITGQNGNTEYLIFIQKGEV